MFELEGCCRRPCWVWLSLHEARKDIMPYSEPRWGRPAIDDWVPFPVVSVHVQCLESGTLDSLHLKMQWTQHQFWPILPKVKNWHAYWSWCLIFSNQKKESNLCLYYSCKLEPTPPVEFIQASTWLAPHLLVLDVWTLRLAPPQSGSIGNFANAPSRGFKMFQGTHQLPGPTCIGSTGCWLKGWTFWTVGRAKKIVEGWIRNASRMAAW